jgi:hypothetical protein
LFGFAQVLRNKQSPLPYTFSRVGSESSFLVAAGTFLAYYTPAYREEARKDGVAVTGEVRRAVDYLTGHDTRP